jgi:hypothetical protein
LLTLAQPLPGWCCGALVWRPQVLRQAADLGLERGASNLLDLLLSLAALLLQQQ